MDKRPDYSVPAELADVEANAAINWVVQIGPSVQGSGQGTILQPTAALYLALGSGNPDVAYVYYSVNAGGDWQPLPNNNLTQVGGSSSVLYRYDAPAGVDWKFLIGLPL